MSDDTKLERQVTEYASLAKENPNIDVASLMINAINQKSNVVSSRTKKWAYLISLGVPPFGLLYALKFYLFSDEEDARHVANICIILTIISMALFLFIGKTMLSSSGTNMQQIEQINPQMIKDTLQ